MSTTTRLNVRDEVDLKIGDQTNTLYSVAEKNDQINDSLQDVVSDAKCHIRRAEIQMRDRKTTYDFPDDMLQPINLTLFTIRGILIFNTVYENIVMQGDDFSSPNSLAVSFNAPGTRSDRRNFNFVQFREIVSDHQFIINPLFDAETINPDNPQVVQFGE